MCPFPESPAVPVVFGGSGLRVWQSVGADLEGGEPPCNVFRAGRETGGKRRDPKRPFLPNPSNFGSRQCCAPGSGDVLGQSGTNRDKPVDTARKT